MLTHTRINLVLAAMISLCLGSVMSAQAPASGVRNSVPSGVDYSTAPISQRAEALAVDVLLESAPCAPQRQPPQPLQVPALVGHDSNTSSGASTGGVSGIEMPFFSFGGVSAE